MLRELFWIIPAAVNKATGGMLSRPVPTLVYKPNTGWVAKAWHADGGRRESIRCQQALRQGGGFVRIFAFLPTGSAHNLYSTRHANPVRPDLFNDNTASNPRAHRGAIAGARSFLSWGKSVRIPAEKPKDNGV
jgi:hypothetical protein